VAFRAFAPNHREHGGQHDAKVESEALSGDIFEVEADALGPRDSVSAAYLSQTRNSGAHREAASLLKGIALDLIWKSRTWSHHAHVPSRDIPELWQFIEGAPSQTPSYSGDSIRLRMKWIIARIHRSEFQDCECPPIYASPLLPKESWSGRTQTHRCRT
jgi:hypothetical protein